MTRRSLTAMAIALLVVVTGLPATAASDAPDQVTTVQPGWSYRTLFTVGEKIDGYMPPGILDGLAAYDQGGSVLVLANHELSSGTGYEYTLANGTVLDGARISAFQIDKATREITGARLAFERIFGRDGTPVDDPADLQYGSLNRFCSGQGYAAGEYGFADDIYLTGEEAGDGTVFALDVDGGDLWAAPDLGKFSWENATALGPPDDDTVVLLIGDDFAPAPLWLYVGTKQSGGGFLERNGLVGGRLYAWVAGDGSTTPEEFNGTGARLAGRFEPITVTHPDGTHKDAFELRAEAFALGAFQFSRPEDVATNPRRANQAVLADTGRGSIHPSNDWGNVYTLTVNLGSLHARVRIAHDGDDFGDLGIRSPDNLDWADNRRIYVQEDAATQIAEFGAVSGRDASIWQLNPNNGAFTRIAEVVGTAVPPGQAEPSGGLGDWETSGILDVTKHFDGTGTILIGDVQAHSIETFPDGIPDLVEGGQLFLIERS